MFDPLKHLKNRIIAVAGAALALLFRSRARSDDFASVKAIAIVKPCCMGDVLMATPALAALRAGFPDARIDFFVGGWSKQMVAGNPRIDEVIDIGSVGSGRYGVSDYLAVVRKMRGGRYDACFVLDRSAFISILPFLAGISRRIGLDSQGRGFSLNVRVPCAEVKHEAELYLDAIRAIGIVPENPRLEFHPTRQDTEKADQILARVSAPPSPLLPPDSTARSPIVVIHPGGGSNPGMDLLTKRWAAERFAAVADAAIAEFGALVLIVGGQGDAAAGQQMAKAMKNEPIDLVGQTTIGELAAICQRSDLFLGNDTGPMHLAAAVGATIIAIFGPTDERVYGPYAADATTITGRSSCRPCFKNGSAPTCNTTECISNVTVEQVWRALRDRLRFKGFRNSDTVARCLI